MLEMKLAFDLLQRRRSILKRGRRGLIFNPTMRIPILKIFQNALCVVRWHKQTSLQSVSSVSVLAFHFSFFPAHPKIFQRTIRLGQNCILYNFVDVLCSLIKLLQLIRFLNTSWSFTKRCFTTYDFLKRDAHIRN